MLIPNGNKWQEGERKRTLSRSLSLGPVSTKVIGVVLVALLALFYLAQSTQSATRNYAIQDLDDRKTTLESNKEELTVEATRLKSLQTIQDKAEELKLEPE